MYKVVRDFHTAVCKALPVSNLLNVNYDNLKVCLSFLRLLRSPSLVCIIFAYHSMGIVQAFLTDLTQACTSKAILFCATACFFNVSNAARRLTTHTGTPLLCAD